MTVYDVARALKIYTVHTLIDLSILLGMFALGLTLIHQYYKSLEKYLTLRVSIEIWNVLTPLFIDTVLLFSILLGYFHFTPDIMAETKMAVPFFPIAVILFTIALILRLFYGGHSISNPSFKLAVWLLFIGNVVNVLGFSIVFGAAHELYLESHPSAFWTYVKTHFRSNGEPDGMVLAMKTFYICFPILMAIFLWGFIAGIHQLNKMAGRANNGK
jgi:hypothetical protein